jgi:hypothetical protein
VRAPRTVCRGRTLWRQALALPCVSVGVSTNLRTLRAQQETSAARANYAAATSFMPLPPPKAPQPRVVRSIARTFEPRVGLDEAESEAQAMFARRAEREARRRRASTTGATGPASATVPEAGGSRPTSGHHAGPGDATGRAQHATVSVPKQLRVGLTEGERTVAQSIMRKNSTPSVNRAQALARRQLAAKAALGAGEGVGLEGLAGNHTALLGQGAPAGHPLTATTTDAGAGTTHGGAALAAYGETVRCDDDLSLCSPSLAPHGAGGDSEPEGPGGARQAPPAFIPPPPLQSRRTVLDAPIPPAFMSYCTLRACVRSYGRLLILEVRRWRLPFTACSHLRVVVCVRVYSTFMCVYVHACASV